MPVYEYKCSKCKHVKDEFRTVDDRNRAPVHCGVPMERVFLVPSMISVFPSYTTVAVDKESGKRMKIGSRAEHSAFLRRNGYEEVGNDKSMAPPSAEEAAERRKKWDDAPDAPMVDVEKLQKEGFIQEDLTS